MNIARLFFLLVAALFICVVAPVWAQTPTTQPKRTYRNPIIDRIGPADPHVIKHNGRYYVNLAGGFKIVAQSMADPLTKKGEPKEVIRPTVDWERKKGAVTEGPWMLKHQELPPSASVTSELMGDPFTENHRKNTENHIDVRKEEGAG